MGAYCLISTSPATGYLLDKIEKQRWLLPESRRQAVSFGRVIQHAADLCYRSFHYVDQAYENETQGSVERLAELLDNQIAQFRLQQQMPVGTTLNVFLLEAPVSAPEPQYDNEEAPEQYEDEEAGDESVQSVESVVNDELAEEETGDEAEQPDIDAMARMFREAFDTLDQQRRADLRIVHVVLGYDIDSPEQVARRLTEEQQQQCRQPDYTMLIDTKRLDMAATFSGKEEHDLKLARCLCDFMTLASASDTWGTIQNAITPPGTDCRCFALGYAECMYYYYDVRDYLQHADRAALLHYLLTQPAGDSPVIDAERNPIGIKAQCDALRRECDDVPLDGTIELYPDSADYAINRYLQQLRPWLGSDAVDLNLAGTTPEDYCYAVRKALTADVRQQAEAEDALPPPPEPEPEPLEPERSGCLGFWPWSSSHSDIVPPTPPEPAPLKHSYVADINEVSRLWAKKAAYRRLEEKRQAMQNECDREQAWCEAFRRTRHQNCPPADQLFLVLDKLKAEHRQGVRRRIEQVVAQYHTMSEIEAAWLEAGKAYARLYLAADWQQPFPFLRKLSDQEAGEIADYLDQRCAAPWTVIGPEPSITRVLFTDVPFDDNNVRRCLANTTDMGIAHTQNVTGKIAVMQFIPK